jgi:hypothetical protein
MREEKWSNSGGEEMGQILLTMGEKVMHNYMINMKLLMSVKADG